MARRQCANTRDPPDTIAKALEPTQISATDTTQKRAFSREQLHQWIWTGTKTATARRLGIRQAELTKACAFFAIPIPDSGFWTKVQMGRDAEVVPLPALTVTMAVEFTGDLFIETFREREARRTQRSQARQEKIAGKPESKLALGVSLIRSAASRGFQSEEAALWSGFSEWEVENAKALALRRFRPREHGTPPKRSGPRYSAPALTLENGFALEAFNDSVAQVRRAVREFERVRVADLDHQLQRSGAVSRSRALTTLLSPLAGLKEQSSLEEDA